MRAAFLVTGFLLLTSAAGIDDAELVFAVITHRDRAETRTYIEPIALVRHVAARVTKVEFLHPPPEKDVVAIYYQNGAEYRVLRGGVPSGIVTVRPADNSTCQPAERFVQRSGTARAPWRAADAIAVRTLEVTRHASVPRSLTASENRELLAAVRRAFALKAVPASALDRIKQENVIAVDLDGDHSIDFIGTFNVDDAKNRHTLFVVVMRDPTGHLRVDVLRYDRTLRAKDDIAAKNWTLVDVEDFDGDGVDEIIVANHGWEWTSYDILKMRREGEWDVIYSGGGSGC